MVAITATMVAITTAAMTANTFFNLLVRLDKIRNRQRGQRQQRQPQQGHNNGQDNSHNNSQDNDRNNDGCNGRNNDGRNDGRDDRDDGNNSCMEPLGTQPRAPSHDTLISSCTRRGLQLQVFSDAGAVDKLHDGAVATQGGKV